MLLWLACCLLIPNIKGIERTEVTFYCTRGIHHPIIENLEMEKDEVITWEFTTFNSSFGAIVGLWLNTFTFVVDLSFQQTSDNGEYVITQAGSYRITAGNFDLNNGYIHIVIENKTEISSYPIFLLISFVGIVVIWKTVKIKQKKKYLQLF